MTQLPVLTAPARAPLRRQPDGRVIAGVAAGLAGHLGVRVAHVRLAFLVLSLFSGAGVLAYGALWVLLPRAAAGDEALGLETASRAGMRTLRHRLAATECIRLPPLAQRLVDALLPAHSTAAL